ncbi:hypothetical protein T09_2646 [Trichinella sp. T9]|nr:hypothetical protein T09_2646 [Trichinella sp. T9]
MKNVNPKNKETPAVQFYLAKGTQDCNENMNTAEKLIPVQKLHCQIYGAFSNNFFQEVFTDHMATVLLGIFFKLPNDHSCNKYPYFITTCSICDIPEKKTAPMQYFNKLEFREIPTLPLFTSKRSIHNSNVASSVIVHIYSKSQISTHTEMSCFMSSIILCEDFY